MIVCAAGECVIADTTDEDILPLGGVDVVITSVLIAGGDSVSVCVGCKIRPATVTDQNVIAIVSELDGGVAGINIDVVCSNSTKGNVITLACGNDVLGTDSLIGGGDSCQDTGLIKDGLSIVTEDDVVAGVGRDGVGCITAKNGVVAGSSCDRVVVCSAIVSVGRVGRC